MMGHFKELAPYAGANMTDERSGILGLDETANYWNEQTGVGRNRFRFRAGEEKRFPPSRAPRFRTRLYHPLRAG